MELEDELLVRACCIVWTVGFGPVSRFRNISGRCAHSCLCWYDLSQGDSEGAGEKVLSVSVQLPQHVSSAIERELVSACAGRVQAASPAGTVVRW